MKKLATVTLSVALALTSTTVFADDKIEDAIDYRQSVFTAIRYNFGTMGDMMKGKIDFDAKEFNRRADNVAALSKMPLEAFIPGSYKDSDDDTDALPAIGENWDKFSKGMGMFGDNAAALASTATDSSSKDDVASAFMKVAKSCKGCHDNFKD